MRRSSELSATTGARLETDSDLLNVTCDDTVFHDTGARIGWPSLRREEFCIDDDDISKEKGSRNESKCFGDSPFFAETIADLVSVVDVERACSTVVAVNVLH